MIEIAPRRRTPRQDPHARPTLVVWALRLWMLSGVLLIARSTPSKASGVIGSTGISCPPKGSRRPGIRLEARNLIRL